ncbi:NTP transferase domain-containing protein [Candidatus Woesearchaeota archaeon]|nr:NTP transferase domain-containing protein [Candidatus Woesearchaeota archaeon]
MKALILAAGFGTRLEDSFQHYLGEHKEALRSWVEGKPKGLVLLHGKPLVGYQVEQLLNAGITKKNIYIHTNALYYEQYRRWAEPQGISVLHNGISSNDHRLGAVGDFRFAFQRIGADDCIVLASDTLVYGKDGLFDFQILCERHHHDKIASIIVYPGEQEKLSRYGLAEIDTSGKIIGFQEKPAHPKSDLVNASVHLYTREMVEVVLSSPLPDLAESGKIIEFLFPQFPIYAERAVRRLDIGTIDDVLRENLNGTKGRA